MWIVLMSTWKIGNFTYKAFATIFGHKTLVQPIFANSIDFGINRNSDVTNKL
jgi:hypothetical protein